MAIAKKGKQIGEETKKKKLICISCGCGVQNNFNVTKDKYHKFFNKIPYCKDCVKSIYKGYLVKYNGNTNLAIYFTCRKIDIPYIHQVYLAAMKESQNENSVLNGEENLLPIYLTTMSTQRLNVPRKLLVSFMMTIIMKILNLVQHICKVYGEDSTMMT